ncbi:uncharacterized protein LOC126260411 [Schistocerca nitens]|uniref:uncharacterized protein LOC126260411 n=1 Tax=Schistocerca nitens TaxID=7011 RepID=UPI0021191BDA|nr:uncharacterized protein LOC126260411 [Schistocerca nitens]
MLGEDVDEELGQWGAALGYMAGPAGRAGSSNGLLADLLDATLSSTTEYPSPLLDAAVNGTPAGPDNDTLCQLDPDCAAALAFRETSRFVVQRILVPILTVIGVTGNMATTVVLSRPRMRSSTNTYLCALAVSDLLYLCFILTLSFKHYPGMDQERHSRYWYYLPYGHWLTDATSSNAALRQLAAGLSNTSFRGPPGTKAASVQMLHSESFALLTTKFLTSSQFFFLEPLSFCYSDLLTFG